jgi:hypothetical protein
MKRSGDIASLFHKYESKKKAILQQLERTYGSSTIMGT